MARYSNNPNKIGKSTIAFKTILKICIAVLLAIILIRLATYTYSLAYNVFRDAPNIYKEKQEYVLNVDKNTTVDKITELLYINGIIEDKTVFKIQAKLAKLSKNLKEGDHKLNSFMSSEEIFENLSSPGDTNVKK